MTHEGKPRILVVDDDRLSQRLLQDMLVPLGYAVSVAGRRAGRARAGAAHPAPPGPARRRDARHGRLRGLRAAQGRRRDGPHPGGARDLARGAGVQDPRPGRRRERLSRQAGRRGRAGAAREEPAARRGVRGLPPAAQRAARRPGARADAPARGRARGAAALPRGAQGELPRHDLPAHDGRRVQGRLHRRAHQARRPLLPPPRARARLGRGRTRSRSSTPARCTTSARSSSPPRSCRSPGR